MNWQDIKVSTDHTHFIYGGARIFEKTYIEVLKFHSPGFAPVQDESGAYHVDCSGRQLYADRFTRTFGFYCNRAAVMQEDKWFHLNERGNKAYAKIYAWVGNFQENLCPVRDSDNKYFHIDIDGQRISSDVFIYCGDFKDGIACVKTANGFYKHIDSKGDFLNDKEYLDLGIFHKNFATAKDRDGWHHIDKLGMELYKHRYSAIEPFYNGFAIITKKGNRKSIIDERGSEILEV